MITPRDMLGDDAPNVHLPEHGGSVKGGGTQIEQKYRVLSSAWLPVGHLKRFFNQSLARDAFKNISEY